ncbi:MAG TPA: hypothetical protein VEJ63_04405 [Planctomycetota bacterium]|nr:hypothetical protein [Planctomycetota bacterium]
MPTPATSAPKPKAKAKPAQIISGLQPATRTHTVIVLPPKPSKLKLKEYSMLLAACVLVAAGIAMSFSSNMAVVRAEKPEPYTGTGEEQATPSAAPAMAPAQTAVAPAQRSSFQPHLGRLRPANLVESLEVDGQKLDFVSFGDLRLPANGGALTVYVLLHAQLDDRTEQAWRRCGMLQDEGRTVSPWLRKVTVRDQNTLDNLIDWHVDKVAVR